VVTALLAALWARARVSLATRVALALPIAHLAVMAVAAFGWFALSEHLTSARDLVPLVEAVPLGGVGGGGAASIASAARRVAGRCAGSLVAAARPRRAGSPAPRGALGVSRGGGTIGRAMIRSWLRGPEIVVQGFEVETRDGTIPVPPGATLAAPLPLSTTML